MLVVHPSSTCDVCLEPYTWTTPRNAPHAIQCGHIFCQQCLENLHPSVCPLCRKSFGSVKKLHVDRLTDVQHGSTVEEDEADLLHRIALHFADGTEVDRAEAIIRHVYEWMAVHPENLSASRTLRTATTALHNYKSLQQKSEGDQRDIRQISENYMNLERNAKADRDRTKKVEEGLLVKVEELEAQIEAQKTQMAVLANTAYQAGVRPHTESTPRHAYGTHQSQSYTSNPLPVPPQQISTGLMAIHPYTSTTPRADPRSRAASITGQHGATVNPNRTNTVRSEAESIVAPGFNPIASSESYRNTSTRPPLMVPGAPHNERVIPPLPPGEFAKEVKEFGRAFSFVPFQRPPMGGFHYGYKPGVGFCWYNTDQEQNITATGSTTRAPYHVAGNDGASGAYPSGGGYPAANVMGTAGWPDVGNTTSPNDAPRNDYSQNETYVGQYPSSAAGRSHYIPNPNGSAAADAEFDYRANANGNNDTSPAFGNQLGMPAGSARGPSPVIPPPPPPPIIFNTPGNTPPPEPSPASTWGTVSSHHSSHASSRADSMANLGLTGLPAFAFPVVEDALASSSEGENAPDGTTPRVRWASHRDRRSSRPQASEPAADAHSSPGLGLQTDPGTSHSSSRQVITHPHDLESVSRSLMQLVMTDNPDAPRSARSSQSRRSPTTDPYTSDTAVGARTGMGIHGSQPAFEGESLLIRSASQSGIHSRTPWHPNSASPHYSHIYSSPARDDRSSRSSRSSRQRRESLAAEIAAPVVPTLSNGYARTPAAYEFSDTQHSHAVSGAQPGSARTQNHDRSRSHGSPLDDYTPTINEPSLLLNFGPVSTSTAVTGTGEEAGIHAPHPVNSRLFGNWHSRNSR